MEKKKKQARSSLPLLMLTIPGLVYLLINNYIPMFGVIIAFKTQNLAKGAFGGDWIGLKNFDFLFKKKKDTTDTHSKVDLSELSYNLINQVLYKIPDNLDVSNFLVSFTTDSASLRLLTRNAVNKDGQLTSTIDINNGAATWHFAGKMRASDKDIDIKLYADGKKVEMPYVDKRYHLKVNFDTLSTRLSKVEQSGGETRIYGSWSAKNLAINKGRL